MPTVRPCVAGVGDDAVVGSGSGAQGMLGKTGKKNVGMLAELMRTKDKSFEACPGALHDGDAVVAGGRSGNRGAHRRGQRGGATAAARSRMTRGG
jgi:hypothetical protein